MTLPTLSHPSSLYIFFLIFNWRIVALQCCVGFCHSTMQTFLRLPLRSHPSSLGGHRAPSWAPCAMWQLPTSHLFDTAYCVCVNTTFSVRPALSPCCVHKSILYIYISIHFLKIGSAVLFSLISYICVDGEGNGTPLQYSCLENPMDKGAWWAAVHGVAKSWTRLSEFTFTFHCHALEKEMATHSSVLAWRIPGMVGWWAAIYGVAQSQTRLKWLSSSSICIDIYFSLPDLLHSV